MTTIRSCGNPNAERNRRAATGEAAGIRQIADDACEYMARSIPRSTVEPGRMPLRSVAGESRWISFSGMPCQSCTRNAPRTPNRFTSPKPCVTTATSARSVAHSPRGLALRTARMP